MADTTDLCETLGCGHLAIPETFFILCEFCFKRAEDAKKMLEAEAVAKKRLKAEAAAAEEWLKAEAAAAKKQLEDEANAKIRGEAVAAAIAAHVPGVILKEPNEYLELPGKCDDGECDFCYHYSDCLEPSGNYVSFHPGCSNCVECGGIFSEKLLFKFGPDFNGQTRTIVPFVRDDDDIYSFSFCSLECAYSPDSLSAFTTQYKSATPLTSDSDTE